MKLELKHLAPYLPYRLKWKFDGEDFTHDIVGLDIMNRGVKLVSPYNDYGDCEISSGKPLLLPMSSLYTEMEDGVVPIVELFKMYETREFDKNKKYSIVFDAPIIDYKWEVYNTIKSEEGILRFIRKTSNMGDLIHSFRYDPELRRFGIYDDSNRRHLGVAYQLDLFTYLFSHHFDVWNLIPQNLAIDKTKIK